MAKGKIIVIEGMDGTGKSTQVKVLYDRLSQEYKKVFVFKFPNYDDDSSIFVRKFLHEGYCTDIHNPYINGLFYALDRSISYYKILKEKYDQGYIIILDRYILSNLIYNLHKFSKIAEQLKFCKNLHDVEFGLLEIPIPDCNIILYSNPSISNRLIDSRYDGNDDKRDHYENYETQKKIYDNIGKLITLNDCYFEDVYNISFGPIETIRIHDDNHIFSIDEIHDKIYDMVSYILS